ncbi:MAG: phytoene/squalene synthase family protein [Deltaproteobacteria bacterium]|nr:phytoene/squalene synthase family protein [Deltaproteobacteria bacterium]
MSALSPTAAREVLARGSRSFGFAARFLTPAQGDDAARVYAWCRLVDDLADDLSQPPEVRLAALSAVRAEVAGRAPPRAEVAGLLAVHDKQPLDLDAALALVDGCASDVGAVRISDDEALLRYAYRVASTVGLLMCGVLGVRRQEALAFAIDLGLAMQLTNICRDVAEDARGGRIYLPATRLAAAGITPEQLLAGEADRAAVASVVLGVLDLAERYYRSAWDGMRFLPLRARLAILVAARVYRRIGLRLRSRGGDALAGRVVVPLAGRLVEAARAVAHLLTPGALGLSPVPRHDADLHLALRGLPAAHPPQREP